MEGTPLLSLPEGMQVSQIQITENGLVIAVVATHPTSCWPIRVFLTKRYDRISSGSLGSALRIQNKGEECRRKTLFSSSLKPLVERICKDVVSFHRKNTDRPIASIGIAALNRSVISSASPMICSLQSSALSYVNYKQPTSDLQGVLLHCLAIILIYHARILLEGFEVPMPCILLHLDDIGTVCQVIGDMCGA